MRKRGRPPYPDILTPREWEVLALLRQELTNEQIAERLNITIHAARYHVSEILSKLGVASRQEAAAWEPEKARPVWMSAVTFAIWPLKHMPFGLAAKASAATVLVGAAGGIALLVWGLVVTSGQDNGIGEGSAASLSATPTIIATAAVEPPTETPELAVTPAAFTATVVAPTPFVTPAAVPTPTGSIPTTTPEPTPAAPEHPLGVFVVSADGSDEPVKVAEDGFVIGWSPDGTLIGVSTLDPDQGGCVVAPAACFRELSLVGADGQGEQLSLGDAQDPHWSVREDKLLFYRFARAPFTTSSGRTFTGVAAQEICVADVATGQTTVLMSHGPITKVEGETVSIARMPIAPPRWSPDDSRVLFGLDGVLYVAVADGSQPAARVTDSETYDADWSPDGRQIIYTWENEIYTVAADGSEPPRHRAAGNEPKWSPDGSRIAFVASTPDAAEIWLLDPDTGESEKLADTGLPPYSSPTFAWSPDGSLILYVGADGVYSVAPEGGAPATKLAHGGPDWSPDGKRMAFTRGFDREDGAPIKSQLFVVNADGGGLTLLADNLTRWCVTYAWSPDSQRVAFSSIYCPLS